MNTPSKPKIIKTLYSLLFIPLLMIYQPVQATTILMQTLDDMVTEAQDVFRGTLKNQETVTVKVKGQDIKATRYLFTVSEMLKGQSNLSDNQYEFTMVGSPGSAFFSNSSNTSFPRFENGQQYLLLMRAPSKIGLSSPIGLANGSFKITTLENNEEIAVNGFQNAGLFKNVNESFEEKSATNSASNQSGLNYETLKNAILNSEK